MCISGDKKFACFNTGLVDKHYDDIYACFAPNEPGCETEWKFTGFCTAANRTLGKQIVNYFSRFRMAGRCTSSTASPALFDLSKPAPSGLRPHNNRQHSRRRWSSSRSSSPTVPTRAKLPRRYAPPTAMKSAGFTRSSAR